MTIQSLRSVNPNLGKYVSLARSVLTHHFDYNLPAINIAERPVSPRDKSRLLLVPTDGIRQNVLPTDTIFKNLASYIPSQSLLVRNVSRVIPARVYLRKETGGRAEMLLLMPEMDTSTQPHLALTKPAHGQLWQVLLGGRNIEKGDHLVIASENLHYHCTIQVVKRQRQHALVRFLTEDSDSNHTSLSLAHLLKDIGKVPLPPYIRRQSDEDDVGQYQTVFANVDGSVAAPTAALHFSDHVLKSLSNKSVDMVDVVLHVGAGTFQQVEATQIGDHHMHQEHVVVEKNMIRRIVKQLTDSVPVVALGTTSVRTVESLYWFGLRLLLTRDWKTINSMDVDQWEPYERLDQFGTDSLPPAVEALNAVDSWCGDGDHVYGRTRLLIVPGYPFKIANALITNFHQPRSTLLMLVSAFYGGQPQDLIQVYEHALEKNYRFLSYGDGSLYASSQFFKG